MVIILKKIEELNITIGKRIKEYRELNKITQEDMAKELDVVPNQYGRIERGENSCTIANFVKICNILKISSDDIIGNLILTKPENNICSEFDKLTLDDKLSVAKYIAFLLSNYE